MCVVVLVGWSSYYLYGLPVSIYVYSPIKSNFKLPFMGGVFPIVFLAQRWRNVCHFCEIMYVNCNTNAGEFAVATF